MSVALRGNLEDFGIADVFQLIGQQRKTGVLEFTGETGHVQLRFDAGLVVAAAPVGSRAEEALGNMLVRCGLLRREQADRLERECEAAAQTVPRLAVSKGWISHEDLERIEDLLTRETFFEVLRWKRGAFDFRTVSVDHSRRVETLLGAEQILMDGLRMIDEWQSFSERVPSEDTVFERSAGFEEYRRRSRLDPQQVELAERVYQLVDGRIPVRRIVDLSLLGTFDAVRLLADLRRAEVIEPVDEEVLQRLRPRGGIRVSLDRGQALGWVAALVCVGLLAAVATLALHPPSPAKATDPAPGYTLERQTLEAVRSAYAVQRLRNAVETHRFVAGHWPGRLEDLEARGLLPPGSLARAGAPPYYYRQRGDGVLLLAPER
jgi:hypothetical protein